MRRFLFLSSFFLLFLVPSFSVSANNTAHTYNSMISEPPITDQSGYVLVVDDGGGLHTIVWSWSYHPQSNAGYGPSDFGTFENYYPILPKPSIRISGTRSWRKLQFQVSTGTTDGQNNNWGQRMYWSVTDYYLSSKGQASVHYYNTMVSTKETTVTFDYQMELGSAIRSAQGFGSSYYSLPSSFEPFNVAWADEVREREYMEEAIDSAVGRLQGTLISEITKLNNAIWQSSEMERAILEEQVAQLLKLQSYLIDFKNQAHKDYLAFVQKFDDFAYYNKYYLNLVQGHLQSIMNMLQESGDYTDIQDVPDDDIGNLGQAEDDLLGGDTTEYESSVDDGFSHINSHSSAMGFLWQVVVKFLHTYDKVFNLFILLMAIGFITLVLGR